VGPEPWYLRLACHSVPFTPAVPVSCQATAALIDHCKSVAGAPSQYQPTSASVLSRTTHSSVGVAFVPRADKAMTVPDMRAGAGKARRLTETAQVGLGIPGGRESQVRPLPQRNGYIRRGPLCWFQHSHTATRKGPYTGSDYDRNHRHTSHMKVSLFLWVTQGLGFEAPSTWGLPLSRGQDQNKYKAWGLGEVGMCQEWEGARTNSPALHRSCSSQQ
jgi:hypothetical protein